MGAETPFGNSARRHPAAVQLYAFPDARVYSPVPAYVPSDTPAGARLVPLQVVHGFAEYISDDLCECLRRGVYQSSQLLDTPFRCHNGLSKSPRPGCYPCWPMLLRQHSPGAPSGTTLYRVMLASPLSTDVESPGFCGASVGQTDREYMLSLCSKRPSNSIRTWPCGSVPSLRQTIQ
jgi:hypothetical protein